ncbi:MAG TPA: hypothetical protein VGL93_14690 [Streptosporangiaceae bacterium]
MTVAALVPAFTAPAAAATPDPPSPAAAGPSCPAAMRFWTPHVAAADAAAADPGAVAPSALSARGRTAFGATLSRMLAGRRGPFRWVTPTGCKRTNSSAAPSGRAARPARTGARTNARTAAGPVSPAAAGPATQSANWSGFESEDGSFTGASMEWKVPAPVAPSPDVEAHVTIWPGIGGDGGSGNVLVQAGTETQHHAGGGSDIYAWTEIVPNENEIEISGFPVHAGDDMAADAAWDPGSKNAVFFLVNYTTGDMTAPITRQVTTGPSGSTAEWIVERPVSCGSTCVYTPLMNFGTESVKNGAADKTAGGTTTSQYIGALGTYHPVDLMTCASFLVESSDPPIGKPAADVNGTGDFTEAWRSVGQADSVNCTWKIDPGGESYRATNAGGSSIQLTDTTANRIITCENATLNGTTGDASQDASTALIGTVTGGDLTSCSDLNGGSWSVSHTANTTWRITGDVPGTDGSTSSDISGISADVTGFYSGGQCAFRVTGDVPKGKASYQNPDLLHITGADLAVSNATGAGCGPAGIANGDTASLAGVYEVISPGIKVNP